MHAQPRPHHPESTDTATTKPLNETGKSGGTEAGKQHDRTNQTAEPNGKEQASKTDDTKQPGSSGNTEQQLSQEEQRQVQKLQQRDREVRAHEAAHKAAAGNLAKGGASFSYERGPDGKLYAVGGEVNIDTGKVGGDPQATLQKAQQIQAAALAPAQPSAKDRAVAAEAAAMAAEARSEMTAAQGEKSRTTATTEAPERSEENNSNTDNSSDETTTSAAATQHYREVAGNQRTGSLDTKIDLLA